MAEDQQPPIHGLLVLVIDRSLESTWGLRGLGDRTGTPFPCLALGLGMGTSAGGPGSTDGRGIPFCLLDSTTLLSLEFHRFLTSLSVRKMPNRRDICAEISDHLKSRGAQKLCQRQV